jgi:hypothetical protein
MNVMSAKKIAGIAASIIAVIVGVYAIMAVLNVTFLAKTPREISIVNGVISVDSGKYQYYQFNIPSSASDVRLSGTFTAAGGSGNDIFVYVMDERALINWQNGHQVNVYYNSGKLTTGNINIDLPTGTFYLVYDNTFSVISSKNIKTTVNLSYKL